MNEKVTGDYVRALADRAIGGALGRTSGWVQILDAKSGEGKHVELAVDALPARFYRVTIGDADLITGSSCEDLAATMIQAALEDMLGSA